MGVRIFRRWLIRDLVRKKYRIQRLRDRIKIAYDLYRYAETERKDKMLDMWREIPKYTIS
jgi:hypothetical protein